MPKIKILRKGSSYPVSMAERVAHKLVQGGGFRYAEESSAKVSKPKRTTKTTHASSSAEAPAKTVKEEAVKEKTETVAVKPTRQQSVTRDDLTAMTKADLKQMGLKMGVDLKPSDSKEEFINKIYRYMRRDMRAER